MQIVGKINIEIYRCVTNDIVTDEVVITEERIQHIKKRHPGDYERFCAFLPEIILDPDYIIEDEHPNTALVLKEITDLETNQHIRLSLRLVTSTDNPAFKNSIITFMKTNKKEYNRLLKNKKLLYIRE